MAATGWWLDFQRDKNRLPGKSQGCSGLITAKPSSKAMSQSPWSALDILISKEFGRVESLRRAAIVARLVFSAGPSVSRIHDGELRWLIEVVGKEVGR